MNKKFLKVSLLMAVASLCLSSCHCLHHHHHGHAFRPSGGFHHMSHHPVWRR